MKLDTTKPFLEAISELAQGIKPYPQRLVEQFEALPREAFLPEALEGAFGERIQMDEGYNEPIK
jgi:hypothetical protein